VALAAAGLADAVAPLGTALTEHQIERCGWCPAPILCFDGDAPGNGGDARGDPRPAPAAPGHILRIVPCRTAWTPTTWSRSRGAAMEALLAAGRRCSTRCGRRTRRRPLATPEDKAGLKARLIDHAETIAHPDIRALYRRDLLDRFGALAYPRASARSSRRDRLHRDRRNRAQARRADAGTARAALPPEEAERLRRYGQSEALLAAVLAGLATRPSEIARHAEASRIWPSDPTWPDCSTRCSIRRSARIRRTGRRGSGRP
jgi:DNA primase